MKTEYNIFRETRLDDMRKKITKGKTMAKLKDKCPECRESVYTLETWYDPSTETLSFGHALACDHCGLVEIDINDYVENKYQSQSIAVNGLNN